jgi:hypothetical protein
MHVCDAFPGNSITQSNENQFDLLGWNPSKGIAIKWDYKQPIKSAKSIYKN